ncbi:MAG TPA: periplasmic heavy metal sensor [Candidatus Acidoferrum sp.]|nr:periplasmic heavy metal sensor [Candidatus Acidoferrum sp.]
MDANTRFRLGFWAFLVVVLLNIGLLALFWYEHFRKPPPSEDSHSNPEQFFIQELRLDQTQADSVKALRREHFRHTDSLKMEIIDLSRRMTNELFAVSPDTALVRDLSEQIGRKQAEFERQVYAHFEAIKEVLRPDQYDKLHELLMDALQRKQPVTTGGEVDRQAPPERKDAPNPNDRRPPPRDDRRPAPPNNDRGSQPPRHDPRPPGH